MSKSTWRTPWLYQTCCAALRVSCAAMFGVRYYGLENIPRQGGLLVTSNHQSHLDPPLIGSAFPRPMSFVARKTLFANPLFARFIASLGALPIDRDGVGLGGVKETLKRLKAGEPVLVFPEGTRSPDGEIQRFKPGFAAMAIRAGASILPAAIEGAFAAWPRQSRFPHPSPVRVQFGVALPPDEIARYDDREIVELVEARVRECHAMLRRLPVFQPSSDRRLAE